MSRPAYQSPRVVATRRITQEHAAELAACFVDLATAGLNGVSSITHREAYDLGIRGDHDLAGLCFRYWRPGESRFSTRFVRLKPSRSVDGRKYLQPVGERPLLYFLSSTSGADLRDSTKPVFIAEGEKKVLALDRGLRQIGNPAIVAGVGGAWSWRSSPRMLQPDGTLGKGRSRPIPDLDLIQWAGRIVHICFDSDVSTNWRVEIAETALAKELTARGAQVRLLRVPGSESKKAGVDDLLAANGSSVLADLIKDAWPFDARRPPDRVHLSDVDNSTLGRRRISVDLMVSAIGESYLVPRTILLECTDMRTKPRKQKSSTLHVVSDGEEDADEPDEVEEEPQGNLVCEHATKNGGRWKARIEDPEILIDFTRTPSHRLHKRLKDVAKQFCRRATCIGVDDRQTLTAFLGTPKSRRLRTLTVNGQQGVYDETGRPYREKMVFFLGPLDGPSTSYRALGVALPNPKSQEATAFFWQMRPLEEDYEAFRISCSAAERFKAFQVSAGGSVDAKVREIGHDVTIHITCIYGQHRELSLVLKLLVFHSVQQFDFDGERLKRGWLEIVEVGDTGQGKTQQVDRTMAATGMGESVDGVSTSRTGLAYSYQKLSDTWFLVWGKYPLNNGRLLFIDEAQNLRPEDIDNIRKGRSDGVISANGVRFGEHPSRTRLIACCNPRLQGVVDDQLFGIELLSQTFKDEDIRRFDVAIISSSSDDKADINKGRPKITAPQLVSPHLLSDSIKWAWSRKPHHVVFGDGATEAVYATARTLVEFYGDARDIPLMLESDARHKVARLAVAMAALVHSTDDTHEKVVVTPEHVEAVGNILVRVYGHSNCSLDLYARLRRDQAHLSDKDYEELWESLRSRSVDGGSSLDPETVQNLLRAFVAHGGKISRSDMAAEIGKTPEWTSKIMGVLKKRQLVRVNRGRAGGYQATPKLTRFLKLSIERKALEP